MEKTKQSPKSTGALTHEMIASFRRHFLSDPTLKSAQNAATRGNIQELAINRDVLNKTQFCFSNEIDSKAGVTDQKRSGTCWMFADMNWLRNITMRKFNLDDFEYSENFMMFWDKLEKANFWLEQIIQLRDQDLDDRKVHHLLKNPISDGGEWHIFQNVVMKYGIIPNAAMPDTFNRESSRFLNEILSYKLRAYAAKIRSMHADGESLEKIYARKTKYLRNIYRILAIFLGTPPEMFDWSYRDKDKNYHQEIQITPLEFYKKYVGLDMNDMVILGNSPMRSTPYGQTFTLEFFSNMVGGRSWTWLNLPIETVKEYALKVLLDNEPCLFGCDVLQQSHSKEGILSEEIYDYDLLFKTTFKMDKQTRMEFRQTEFTHCMVLVGVDLVDNKPIKWKIENSWGKDVGKRGFFIMSDKWFEEHLMVLVINRKYLAQEHLALFDQTPVILPPWSPI